MGCGPLLLALENLMPIPVSTSTGTACRWCGWSRQGTRGRALSRWIRWRARVSADMEE